MKIVHIAVSDDDLLELKMLADRIEREQQDLRRLNANAGGSAGAKTSQAERDAQHEVETLRRILKTARGAK